MPESGSRDVDAYMAKLDHPLKAEIEAVRAIIKAASPKLAERVKWNAPSFYYQADMAAFNLRRTEFVQLILIYPKGLVGDEGLLRGTWKDRREARFHDMKDVRAKRAALERVVKGWVKRIDE